MADEVLSYRSAKPERPREFPRVNWWCVGPFFATFLVVAPFAGMEVGGLAAVLCAAVAGYGWSRATDGGNRLVALMAIFACAVAPAMRGALERSGSSAVGIQCASQLRVIGKACLILEESGRVEYGLDDVSQLLGDPYFRCPSHEGTGRTSVLLPHLQPYSKLPNRASVVVGYCLMHHPPINSMVLLYGDGHVEMHDPAAAQKLISESMGATTRPAR